MEGEDLALFERSIRHATKDLTGGALDRALLELGWHDALALDQHAAVSTFFTQQGLMNATSTALDHVIVAGLGRESDLDTGWIHPVLDQDAPPGALVGANLSVHGLATYRFSSTSRCRLVAREGDLEVLVTVDTEGLAKRDVSGIDPTLGLVEVRGEAIVVDSMDLTPGSWSDAVVLARLALAHELLGAGRRMLELAREHALGRIQFGQPISAFQAVRHRLADTLVAVEGAESALAAAWGSRSAEDAAMGKALAGRAALTAARHCQQVMAGIGFTTEHPFHRYVRRVLVLDHILGSARSLTRQLGAELLQTRRLPPLIPL